MRLIPFVIIVMVLADSAYSRVSVEENFIYQNNEVSMDGSPTVMRVQQWVSGATARTTVKVSLRTCQPVQRNELILQYRPLGPNNLIKVKQITAPATQCANPIVQTLLLYSSTIKPIELADIRVNKKTKVLWVFSNRAPYGSGN